MRFRQRVTLAHAESLPLPITLVEHPRERSQCGKPAAKGTHTAVTGSTGPRSRSR